MAVSDEKVQVLKNNVCMKKNEKSFLVNWAHFSVFPSQEKFLNNVIFSPKTFFSFSTEKFWILKDSYPFEFGS